MKWEDRLLKLFGWGLMVKIVLGALEIAAAIGVLLAPPMFVIRLAELATGGELAGDPGDTIAHSIREAAHSFAVHPHYLLALYLVARGLVKVVLAGLIMRGYRLAYPFFMFALLLFGAYEIYRAYNTVNILLAGLALFDFSMAYLTAHEYRFTKSKRQEDSV